MKKIILEEKTSEIHVSEVSYNAAIIIKKQGKEFGVMIYNGELWECRSVKAYKEFKHLSDACKWFGAYCEFYVLD